MSAVATLPNPCLVAILLVCNTRTGSGSQILFHYPPALSSNNSPATQPRSTDDTQDDTTSTDSGSSAHEDDLLSLPRQFANLGASDSRLNSIDVGDDDLETSRVLSSHQSLPGVGSSGTFFGFAEDGLVSLLAPDRTWHKRKFEMGINDLTFVSRPMFVRHDGSWKRQRRRHRKQRNARVDPITSDTATASEDEPVKSEHVTRETSNTESQAAKSPLTMFNVVFVMNPPQLEHSLRVKDMYDHVIKKFSKVLKWEQVRHDYVWEQSELIMAIKSSTATKRMARTSLLAQILEQSSLAAAIANIYTAISSSRIASITLSPNASISLQIPLATSTSQLPSLTDPPIQPGLWLTTATDTGTIASESDGSAPGSALQLAKHYTLLLKSPPSRIAKDAHDSGGLLALHLPRFIAELRPTKSFYKLSIASQISLADIQVLAEHLIYWRRAVAIPPLHQSDTYIVSPNADMTKLREAIKNYESQFPPSMPSLPKMLSALSGIPKSFGSLIPSTDHKEKYYLALAWLMRNGWVTQLRTFGYIRVDPEVKKAVSHADREAKIKPAQSQSFSEFNEGRDTFKPRKRPSIISRPSSDGKQSTFEGIRSAHNNQRMASLILSPPRASAEESKWLDQIAEKMFTTSDGEQASNFESGDRTDLRKYWPILVKYLDGHVGLETVPVREGLKRKFVWNMLHKLGMHPNQGVEDENGENRAIVVPIRHW